MTLHLANITLRQTPYMGEVRTWTITRLVRADSTEEAEQKIRAKFEKDDPYGVSVDVDDVEISAIIE